jgi:hypothetical protein
MGVSVENVSSAMAETSVMMMSIIQKVLPLARFLLNPITYWLISFSFARGMITSHLSISVEYCFLQVLLSS